MLCDLRLLPSARTFRAKRSVLVINGHPDSRPERFCAALCAAFARAAVESGRTVQSLDLREDGPARGSDAAFERLLWSDSLFVAYPMWLDGPPLALRRMFDAFACAIAPDEARWGGKRARVVVTASLPSLFYRKSGAALSGLVGLEAAPTTIIGSVDTISDAHRARWLEEIRRLGTRIG